VLTVKNDGKTIPAEKLTKVFDRFYQTDKTAEGSGLGLAIAKAVAERNGWKIRAESDKKTTSFILEF
jgi:signal transduction histidine kinase